MPSEQEQDDYHQLCAYTLSLRDATFIHQQVVDAYAAQNADENTKPIALTFALIGLYLHEEKYSGKQVQRAHMELAQKRKQWPKWPTPVERGSVNASDVISAPPGADRNKAIERWCESVWTAWKGSREEVRKLVKLLNSPDLIF